MDKRFSLAGKKIVIIGGAGLLGSAFSRACKESGAMVTIADIDETRGLALAKKIGVRYQGVDITSPASVAELAQKVGTVDGVVNATYPKTKEYGKSFAEAEVSDMLEDLSLHIGGSLSIAQAFAPAMKKRGGSIVFLASIYGVAAPRFEIYEGTKMSLPAEYAAIKGGTIALTRYFAALFGKSGIRVNAISPGGVSDTQPKKFVDAYSKHLKIGRGLLSPQDISGALIYLLSDASKQMTGQNLIVDGGWTL